MSLHLIPVGSLDSSTGRHEAMSVAKISSRNTHKRAPTTAPIPQKTEDSNLTVLLKEWEEPVEFSLIFLTFPLDWHPWYVSHPLHYLEKSTIYHIILSVYGEWYFLSRMQIQTIDVDSWTDDTGESAAKTANTGWVFPTYCSQFSHHDTLPGIWNARRHSASVTAASSASNLLLSLLSSDDDPIRFRSCQCCRLFFDWLRIGTISSSSLSPRLVSLNLILPLHRTSRRRNGIMLDIHTIVSHRHLLQWNLDRKSNLLAIFRCLFSV